jgi:hypothetical protein
MDPQLAQPLQQRECFPKLFMTCVDTFSVSQNITIFEILDSVRAQVMGDQSQRPRRRHLPKGQHMCPARISQAFRPRKSM